MAKLGTKPHLVASLNVMLASRDEDEALTQDEIIEILSAMAETDAMSSTAQVQRSVHWQQAPRRVI